MASFSTLVFLLLLLYTMDIPGSQATNSSLEFPSNGLDPGTAMACNYFYGYLKIVLQASEGNKRAGILTALEKYEAVNSVEIPVKKLFILIPSSSCIPTNFKESSDHWMEHSGSLDTVTLDRAGVIGRTYHNTVYRIRPEGPNATSLSKSIYLAVEGATPLKTFLEVQEQSSKYGPLYKIHNTNIIHKFYETLQNLLNDNPDFKEYCELVYYEDMIDDKRVNLASVLLEKIAHIQKTSSSTSP